MQVYRKLSKRTKYSPYTGELSNGGQIVLQGAAVDGRIAAGGLDHARQRGNSRRLACKIKQNYYCEIEKEKEKRKNNERELLYYFEVHSNDRELEDSFRSNANKNDEYKYYSPAPLWPSRHVICPSNILREKSLTARFPSG